MNFIIVLKSMQTSLHDFLELGNYLKFFKMLYFLGAICTYLVGFLKLRWDIFGELTLALCSIIQGCLILQITRINVLLINYVLFICFRTIYQASNAIAS